MANPRVLAFAQLMRLPNVFTAFADIALATAAGVAVLPVVPAGFWASVVTLALTSGCLYLAGMVWNDYFDRAEDAVARPFRPIPSGRVAVRTALLLGTALCGLGLGFAALAGATGEGGWSGGPLAYAVAIAAAVLIYDGGMKRTAAGPLAMASCRFLNVLLGLSMVPDAALDLETRLHLAGVVGVYIVGVTWFARTEEGRSSPRHLFAAAGVLVVSLILALALKARLPLDSGTVAFPYLVVLFGFYIGRPVARAVSTPGPREVQAAVKRCVLGLVVLDAVLATAFVGLPGLLILLLLPPALVIGKWVYST
ncbi:UbiA family prenyltransferase [Gemmata sp.]|uniref:UbiA family prenyltransferase n=1 Tax=Gemmata sp. TaxID=1914242 RepID=UPI003F701FE9